MHYFKRITAIYVFLAFMMSLCLISVYRASVSDKARSALSGQYTRKITVAQRRGIIYDRNETPLSAKECGYVCLVNPMFVENSGDAAKKIASAAGIAQSEVVEKFLLRSPFLLSLNSTDALSDIHGIYCFPKYEQSTEAAVHVIGYTDREGNGITGMQGKYDGYLSGVLSGTVTYSYIADASGRSFDKSGSLILDDGYTEKSGVVLTLDAELQKVCEEISQKHLDSGAVLVIDIASGDILSSVSLPLYDSKSISKYLNSDKGELLNRCNLTFTPGSIFKTVVAAAALSADREIYTDTFECKGYYELSDGRRFSCHKKSGHGTLSMKEAYAQSCNPYFINLALKIGQKAITDMAVKMGLKSIADNPYLLEESTNAGDYEGLCANIAIGQGPLLVSPTETAAMFATAASGFYREPGTLMHIFRNGSIIKERNTKAEQVLSNKVCELLCEMMQACIEEGLGATAKPRDGDAGGKTATAQTGRKKNGKELLNTWFCGVYPISEPEYAIAVLCDGGNKNDTKSVYREICEYLKALE